MTTVSPFVLENRSPASSAMPAKCAATVVYVRMPGDGSGNGVSSGGVRRAPFCQLVLYFLLGFVTACLLISLGLSWEQPQSPAEWAAQSHNKPTPGRAVATEAGLEFHSAASSLLLRDPVLQRMHTSQQVHHQPAADDTLLPPPAPAPAPPVAVRTASPVAVSTVAACEVSNVTVNGVPVGDVISHLNMTPVAHCSVLVRGSYFRCAGFFPVQDRSHRWEDRLVRSHDPILFPMHGGVTAKRMMKLMLQLSEHCPLPLADVERWPNGTVIVELGSGNAAGLSVLAPPRAGVYGVGTDIAKALVDHGTAFFPHLHLHRAIGAPMVPTGAATCVYSIGVVLLLTGGPMCNHLSEGLRLLKPGGRLIVHTVAKVLPRYGGWSLFDESFFQNGTDVLPLCTGVGALVSNVEMVHSRSFAVYNAPQFFAVVLTRNAAPLPCEPQSVATSMDALSSAAAAARRSHPNMTLDWYHSRIQDVMGRDAPLWSGHASAAP